MLTVDMLYICLPSKSEVPIMAGYTYYYFVCVCFKETEKVTQYIIIKDYNRVEEKSDAQELLTP